MTDGRWLLTIEGKGKIDPGGDQDEIQEMAKAFRQELTNNGHEITTLDIRKIFEV